MTDMASLTFIAFATLAAAGVTKVDCPPLAGSFSIAVAELYPESADWDPHSCRLYISSLYNSTLVAYDPYNEISEIIDLPGISGTGEYHLDGVDYDQYSGFIYVAAASANAFAASSAGNYSNANYTGPNNIVRYDPTERRIVSDTLLQHAQQQYQHRTSNLTNGFQDMAENSLGDSFAIGTFGNSIVKISKHSSQAYLWYAPSTYDVEYGFGGIFSTPTDKLVISDTISGGLVTFDSRAQHPQPTYVALQGLPSNYRPLMADGLFAPKKYHGKIALWSDDYNGTSVYKSDDDWETARFLGLVPINETIAVESGFVVASFEIGESIFSLAEFFQQSLPVPQRLDWPVVEITKEVDAFVHASG